MAVVTAKLADFLRDHSPAGLERELGLGPGDLLDPRRDGATLDGPCATAGKG